MHTNISFFPSSKTKVFLDRTYQALQLLQMRFGDLLKITPSYDEIDCMKSWMESYKYGSTEAAGYLSLYGSELLCDVHNDLSLCLKETQNMDEESPVSRAYTEATIDEISNAICMINFAENTFKVALIYEIENELMDDEILYSNYKY